MSSFWKGRSYFSGSNTNNGDDLADGYGSGQQYSEPSGGGKKRPSSRLRRSSKQTDDDDAEDAYPNYTARSPDYGGGGNSPYYNGSVAVGTPYYGGGGSYGYGNSSPYSSGGGGYGKSSPYNNGGGGYGNSGAYTNGGGYGKRSPYRNGGDGYGNNSAYSNGSVGEGGYYSSYNLPSSYGADGSRSPMVIQTKEVNVYGTPPRPQYDNDDNYNDQRGGGGGRRGFFGPAFHSVGHFFDRRFGIHDRE